MSELRTTPLTDWHREHGGKMVEFAGYSMPIRFPDGVITEHKAVRETCGIFDVSHMGELEVRGAQARDNVHRLVTNNVKKLEPGQVLYSAMCTDSGGIVDDVLVYCLTNERFMIVCNASNHEKVAGWVGDRLEGDAALHDETFDTALFAVQGPRSLDVLKSWSRAAAHGDVLDSLQYYHCTFLDLEGVDVLLSRTGYTGEKGYELYVPTEHARTLWEELLAAGVDHGLRPIGLGARDTLRLEAGYSLYGNELSEDVTPYEAGIGWTVKSKAGDFHGRDVLVEQKEAGVPRRTVALKLPGRNIPRQGATVQTDGEDVGVITSGSFSPVLECGIGLARVATPALERDLTVDVRGKQVAAERVRLPFVPSRVKD